MTGKTALMAVMKRIAVSCLAKLRCYAGVRSDQMLLKLETCCSSVVHCLVLVV